MPSRAARAVPLQQRQQQLLQRSAELRGDVAQAWLRLQGYEPTVLRIDAFTRLGARLSKANVAFDDHPDAQRYAGRIATVTADSVFAWMEQRRWSGPEQIVR